MSKMKKSTDDCKIFLTKYFMDRGGSELFGSIDDLADYHDSYKDAEDFYNKFQRDLMTPSEWKRLYKRKEGPLILRGFALNPSIYDSQVAYEVVEDSLGNLIVGDYIGD
jgi:hypothetical protein